MEFPIVVRMPYGGGVRAPELHDDSPETYYVHTPGVKVAIPSTPADAKGLLAAAIRDPDPVVVLEPKLHYRTIRGEVPDGRARRAARQGADRPRGLRPLDRRLRLDGAAGRGGGEALAGEASVEVLDLRSLKPLDEDALLATAAKTGRVVIVQEAPRVCGFAAEVAAVLAEKAILDLRGPVLRVTGYDVPYPFWQLEDAYMPSVARVRRRRAAAAGVLNVLQRAGVKSSRARHRLRTPRPLPLQRGYRLAATSAWPSGRCARSRLVKASSLAFAARRRPWRPSGAPEHAIPSTSTL